MSFAVTLVAGVVFGFALAAPPGPMNAVIAEESVLRGWTAGFKTGLGAMSADVLFFLLALAGLVTFVRGFALLQDVMFLVGGLLMLYFAYSAIRGATRSLRAQRQADSRGFSKAFLLSLTNPYQILFWLTVGIGLLTPGSIDVLAYASSSLSGILGVETGHPALIIGLFAGIACWIVGFPAALTAAELRTKTFAPIVAYVSAIVLAGFGLYFLTDVLLF